MSDLRRLVLWRGVWHFAEHDGRSFDPVPLTTICGREVPENADVRVWQPTADVCGSCRRSRPLWLVQ